MRLKDKVSIITGGAQGIGRSYALGFSGEGSKIVIADINMTAANKLASEIIQSGGNALAFEVDVSSEKDTIELAKEIYDHFGSIDILVNNASLYVRIKMSRVPVSELSPDEWDRVMAVNLKGTFLCSKAVLPYMVSKKSGKIINISSGLAFSGMRNAAHYIASKAGVTGFTRALALEVGDYNINVNCIAPGSTFSEDPDDSEALEFRKKAISQRAIKRLQYPEDLVGAAIFLASDDSDFITGQTIVVDGGTFMH